VANDQDGGDQDGGERSEGDAPAPDRGDEVLLAAFDRLRPQGSLPWGFEDGIRRLADPAGGSGAAPAPWEGLPADLWERGRSARIGRRFVGDVAGVLAGLLAEDARQVARDTVDRAVGDRLGGAVDALRYLADRVDTLEAMVDPARDLVVPPEASPAPPDLSAWIDAVPTWFGAADARGPVLVAESGAGELLTSLERAGLGARGVEPRGPLAWSCADWGIATGGVEPGEAIDTLATMGAGEVGGVVLAGAVDRLPLAGKLALVREAVRVAGRGGTVALLVTDPDAWDRTLTQVARDLAPGRPLHPATWIHVLARLGAPGASWLTPATGDVHAVVGTVGG